MPDDPASTPAREVSSVDDTGAVAEHPRPAPGGWGDDLDRWLARPMWAASFLFLAVLACELQRVRGTVSLEISLFGGAMLLLWPLFLAEGVAHFLVGSKHCRYHIFYTLFPPLRMGARDHATWRRIWLPWVGWHKVGRELRDRIHKQFSMPMILIAMAVFPLLGIEWLANPPQLGTATAAAATSEQRWLRVTVDTGTSVIWFAFAFELIVMLSIVRKKLRYCVEHWVDVAIVALPMVAFLRVVWLIKIGNVSRLLRMYRLRGMAIRAYRAVLMLDIVRRVLHINPERRLRVLRERLEEYNFQMEEIQREMRELEIKIAARRREEEMGAAEGGDAGGIVDASPES